MQNRLEVKVWKAQTLPPDWFKRTKATEAKDSEALEKTVKKVIQKVREKGDAALIEYAREFDGAKLDAQDLGVTQNEIKSAYGKVSEEQIAALRLMKEKLETLEKRTLQQQPIASLKKGITVQTVLRPIESVGCYVPGGQAVYPSTLVMAATPAKIAGVPRIVVCSPVKGEGSIDPLILVAADICGVDEIFKVGGAQAIAALAYGTDTIEPVRKIVGPGSKFVTVAKMLVSNDVAIDMPAGPSEILVLADETADPKLIAADMISQAEHGADSVSGLITTSNELANEVLCFLRKMVARAERGPIVASALSAYGFMITCESINEMVGLANIFAPEHLEIMTRNPLKIADKITTAGLILVGPYSPVALSDYGSGTNHVLPTGGFGSAFSGLSVLDFTRRVNIVESSKEGLCKLINHVKVFTEAEKLPNHYKAVEARFEK